MVKPGGNLVVMCTNPDAYECVFRNVRHRFLESRSSGSPIKAIVTNEAMETIEITDYIWTEEDYVTSIRGAGFVVREIGRATTSDPSWTTDEFTQRLLW